MSLISSRRISHAIQPFHSFQSHRPNQYKYLGINLHRPSLSLAPSHLQTLRDRNTPNNNIIQVTLLQIFNIRMKSRQSLPRPRFPGNFPHHHFRNGTLQARARRIFSFTSPNCSIRWTNSGVDCLSKYVTSSPIPSLSPIYILPLWSYSSEAGPFRNQ